MQPAFPFACLKEKAGFELSEKIVSRPNESVWASITFGAIAAAAYPVMLITSNSGTQPLLVIGVMSLAAVLFIPVIGGGVWAIRSRIVADTSGLHWRTATRSHFAAWHEISDYYDVLAPSGRQATPRMIVERHGGGPRLIFSRDWSNVDELRRIIQRNAFSAKTTQWQVKGTRLCDDWPQTFDYNTFDSKFHRLLIGTSFVFGFGFYVMTVVPSAQRTWTTLGAGWDVGTLAVGLFMPLTTTAPLLICVPFLRDIKRRADQSITLSPHGILFTNGNSDTVSAAWGQVKTFYRDYGETAKPLINVPRYVIETASGQISFGGNIRERNLLCEIVCGFATHADVKRWSISSERARAQRLKTDNTNGANGVVRVGEHVYHYRSHITRAFLWFPFAFSPLFLMRPLLLAFDLLTWKKNESITTLFVLSGCFFALSVWAAWRYHAARIVVSGAGITEYKPFSHCFLRWSDVTDFYQSGDSIFIFGNVASDSGEKVRFWLGMENADELKAEIMRRATRPPRTVWKV